MIPKVEDINIHQIIERVSMSCIESSGERFSIFRNRSFTLFRNERDFRERSDSAAVSESISISNSEEFDELASNTGFPVPVCCTFITSSEVLSDFQIWCSPGFQMQSMQARSDPLHGISIPNSSSAFILL